MTGPTHTPTPPVVPGALGTSIDDLTAAVEAGTASAGRLLGLPELPGDGVWVDIAGAAAVVGVASQTITGWVNSNAPQELPFPAPQRILYRLYWPLADIQGWMGARPPR
ncbi:hypothetical protein [Phytomonospora endophytica]|uniref:Putative DNA-binding transcriptional regulator AlpA n=1 Tax=Phytomonospora endophytica TaxID=714109 RepID=A0A841G327_9ACTN|nr:hypothetical protein [Phytomonospora endophytica]MBB6038520.1 putative DNA-binding transcriptional regulator AlpA [Phytomonospora endophytica]